MTTYVKYDLGDHEEEKCCCFRGNAVFGGYVLTFLLPIVVGGIIFSTPWIAHSILKDDDSTQIQQSSWFWNSTSGRFLCNCCVNCDSPVGLKSLQIPVTVDPSDVYEASLVYKIDEKCLTEKFLSHTKREDCESKCRQNPGCRFYEVNSNRRQKFRCRTMNSCSGTTGSANTTVYYKDELVRDAERAKSFEQTTMPLDAIEGSSPDTDDEDIIDLLNK